MIDRYIVSFEAGTSGRFICSIVWNLINDFDIDYSFTDRNSAHLSGPWVDTVDAPGLELSISDIVNHPDVYSIIEYTDKNVREYNPYSSGLLQTHTYPDYDIIRSRLPDAKIILITFDENDLLEILLNVIYKNLFDPVLVQGWIKPLLEDKQYFYLFNRIKQISDEYNNTGLLPDKQYMKYVCVDFCLWKIYNNSFTKTTKFLDKNDENNLDENVLVLKYKDIFTKENGEYIALTKISNFTKKEFKSNSLLTYKKYIEGRNNFLKTTIPLIDDIKHHIKINNKKSTVIWPNVYSYKNSYSLDLNGPEYILHNRHEDIWPAINIDYQNAIFAIGYTIENDKTMIIKMHSSIWPSTYNYDPIYAISSSLNSACKPDYNYEYHMPITVWPNILTHHNRPEYSIGEFLVLPNYNYKFNTYNNIWPIVLKYNINPAYYLEKQILLPNYNYEYHIYNNIWPNILSHDSKPSKYLGSTYSIVHNANVKGSEYIISTIMNSFSELLLPTLWSIENELPYDFDLLNQIEPWTYSINIFDLGSYTHPQIFNEFKFEYYNYKGYNFNHIGLLHTTMYPDFEVIYNRYPNTKIILISLDEDDKLEITTNIVYKKWLTTKLEKLHPFDKMQIQNAYMDYYGKTLEFIDNLEKDFVDFFIKKIYNVLERKSYFTSHVNPIIPDEYKEKILVIKHKDFFTKNGDQYLGLENLSKFINQPVNEDITYKYNSAIEKRETFVEKYLPHYEN
jgi:hypothetical protein